MRFRLFLSRVAQQQGIILLFIIAVATLWLAVTGRLTLYIHQRYIVFTTSMAVVALVMASASVITQSRAYQQTHFIWWRRATACVMVCMVAGMALLVPPTALTTTTATQRGINKGAVTRYHKHLSLLSEIIRTSRSKNGQGYSRKCMIAGFIVARQST